MDQRGGLPVYAAIYRRTTERIRRLKVDEKIKTILNSLESERVAHLQISRQHFLVDKKDNVYIISPSSLKKPASQKEIDSDKADISLKLGIDL